MYKKGFLSIFLGFLILFLLLSPKDKKEKQELPESPKQPPATGINDYIFSHREYDKIIQILKDWEDKASNLVDVSTYGKSSQGKDLYYIKLSNEYKPGKDVILITSCIHGNEPLSTSTTLAYIGYLLSKYNVDSEVTEIINSKQIYYIPVVSPDSYSNKRHVDGVDPNRDFPTLKNPDKQSVKPIMCLREFFLKIKPNSVLSGHTYGRMFLMPWGDTNKECPDHSNYKDLVSRMASSANYRYMKASELYNSPIFGSEIDWYYRNGACGVVMEFGLHQNKPTLDDTENEFKRTLDAFIIFLKDSTSVVRF